MVVQTQVLQTDGSGALTFADQSGGLSNIVEDTTQLGGNLDTNSNNILIDDAHYIADENGNEQIVFSTTASAVNSFQSQNATGNAVDLAPVGGDTNIDINPFSCPMKLTLFQEILTMLAQPLLVLVQNLIY